MKQAPPVKNSSDLVDGKDYILSELPDGIFFNLNGATYKTITYPQFNTINYKQTIRPCLNLLTLKSENLKYGTLVTVTIKTKAN